MVSASGSVHPVAPDDSRLHLATMPYIALQLMGIESVLTVMGIGSTSGNAFIRDLPLIITSASWPPAPTWPDCAPALLAVRQGHPHLRHGHRRDALHPVAQRARIFRR